MMVMELMQGGELFDLIRTKRRFTEKEAINFTRQVIIQSKMIQSSTWERWAGKGGGGEGDSALFIYIVQSILKFET